MAKLEENKFYTEGFAIERAPLPAKAYIPLSQHIGKPCDKILVNPGDSVLAGQLLATSDAKLFAPVHSSISGKVLGIQNWPHPSLGDGQAIVIENDGLDKRRPMETRSSDEIEKLTPEKIRQIIFDAGIVGMGGAAFPTHVKLNPPKHVHTLIINIAECEPYLTGDSQLVVQKTAEIILGIELVRKCLNSGTVIIAIEENKPHAIEALKKVINRHIRIQILKSHYPQGGEKQLVKNVLGKEVPQGKLPFDVGVNVQNVSTVYAIYEAVYQMKPLYERVVTVTGSLLAHPKNVLARIGTPIKELIGFCGPVKEKPAKIIVGGPMMGTAQYTDNVPVIKSTTGIILLNKKEAGTIDSDVCIRCGRCVKECPMGLMPCMMSLYAEKGMWQQAKTAGVMDCIECGLCTYLCPARKRIVQNIKRAKLEAAK